MTQQEIKEQRIAIIKDAIGQLKAHRFKAATGRVIHNQQQIGMYDIPLDTELQPIFKKAKKCVVCGRGALFISAVRQFNNCTLRRREQTSGINSFLGQWFTIDEIIDIEGKFELFANAPSDYYKEKNKDKRLLRILNELLEETKQS